MAELMNVIYDIERCICHVPDACRDCSHYPDKNGGPIGCMEDLLSEALELLKKLKEDNVRLDRENQKLIEQMAQQPQDDANDDDDYDPCYECRGLGDDYIINDDGELESWCDKCGVNPDRMKDKE